MLKNTCYTIIINIKKGRRLQKKDELMKEVYIDIMEKAEEFEYYFNRNGRYRVYKIPCGALHIEICRK